MIKFLATFILFLCFVSEGFTQKSLNDYSFVIVPEKFDFVNEKDKYQLNSLTKFLFNKHGFNAYFESERPDVKRCDGLYAQVDGKPAMIRTKVTVILKDCYGEEVYRTAVGKSKLKAYNKTYTAALRQAFLSIDSLDVQQREPTLFGGDKLEEETTKVIPAETVAEATPVKVVAKAKSETGEEPADEVSYSQNGKQFTLKRIDAGYMLLEKLDDGDQVKGHIQVKDNQPVQFEDENGNKFPCYFDEQENFVIETSFQKLKFTKVDQ